MERHVLKPHTVAAFRMKRFPCSGASSRTVPFPAGGGNIHALLVHQRSLDKDDGRNMESVRRVTETPFASQSKLATLQTTGVRELNGLGDVKPAVAFTGLERRHRGAK